MTLNNVAIVLSVILWTLSGCTSTAPGNTTYARTQEPGPNAVFGSYNNDDLDPGRGLYN